MAALLAVETALIASLAPDRRAEIVRGLDALIAALARGR